MVLEVLGRRRLLVGLAGLAGTLDVVSLLAFPWLLSGAFLMGSVRVVVPQNRSLQLLETPTAPQSAEAPALCSGAQ